MERYIDHVREVGVSNDEHTSTDTEVFDVLIPTGSNDTPSIPESASEDSGSIASSSTSTNVDSSSPSDIYHKEDTHNLHGNQIHGTLNCNCYLVIVNFL